LSLPTRFERVTAACDRFSRGGRGGHGTQDPSGPLREGSEKERSVNNSSLSGLSGNKDVLFDVLIQRYFDEILEQIRGLSLDLSRPFEITLRAAISTSIRAQRHGPELLRALEYVPNAVFRRRLREGKQQLVAFVRTLLEDTATNCARST